jgi:hypothetical protein
LGNIAKKASPKPTTISVQKVALCVRGRRIAETINHPPRAAFTDRPHVRPDSPARAAVTASSPAVHPVTRWAAVCGHRKVEKKSKSPRTAFIALGPMVGFKVGTVIQSCKANCCHELETDAAGAWLLAFRNDPDLDD